MIGFVHKFLYILKGKHRSLIFIIFLSLLTSVLEVVGIGMVGPFIAVAVNPESIQENAFLTAVYTRLQFSHEFQFLLVLGLAISTIFFAKVSINFNVQKYIFDFGFTQKAELAYRLMKAYLAAPYTFHLDRNSATLIHKITDETDRFARGLLMPLLTSVSNAIVICALVILLVKTSALAMAIVAGILLIAIAIVYWLKDPMKLWGKEMSQSRADIFRIINHGLGGLKETKIIGCESYFEAELHQQVKRYGKNTALVLSYSNLPRYLIEAFLITFLIIFTILFIILNKGNSAHLSSVLGIFSLASIRLLPAISNVVSSINGIRASTFSLDQLYSDFKDLEKFSEQQQLNFSSSHSLKNPNKQQTKLSFVNSISLTDVVYRYPHADRNSLEKVSLVLNKGESIGLIGKSGAGKTTLVDVILGLLTPQVGDITIDGVSIYTNLRAWQNTIAYVPQTIFLIDGTLKQNIAFGVPDLAIDEERLMSSLKAAQLSDLVKELPLGWDTKVGERGVLLSGGQRQRIGIARALYHNRDILVFDEATAALDNETENLVSEAIKSLSGIKTTIIIAHRLTTVEHCDRLYEMNRGRIVKSGKYQDVVLNT